MLTLSESTLAEVARQASEHPDIEVCGLVWQSEGGQTVYPLANVHPQPAQYYRTAPKDVRAAFDAMDRDGGQPLAWYHSHPNGKSEPSETDMQGAFNTGMYYLIAYPSEFVVATVDLEVAPPPERPRYAREWRVTAWECLSQGILVSADYEVLW